MIGLDPDKREFFKLKLKLSCLNQCYQFLNVLNQKAKKVLEKLNIKKNAIDFYFWAKKTLDQDPGSRIRNLNPDPDPHPDKTLDPDPH